MRIFSKRVFMFELDGSTYKTPYMGFINLPDKAKDHPYFKLAQADGQIEIISNKATERQAELTASSAQQRERTSLLGNKPDKGGAFGGNVKPPEGGDVA